MQEIAIASKWQTLSFQTDAYSNNAIPLLLRFRGPLDRRALARALEDLFERHAALRTKLVERDGRVWQVVSDAGPPLPPSVCGEAVAVDPAALEATLVGLIDLPFRFDGSELVRIALLALGPDEHVLALVMHHVLGDGWSLGVLSEELPELYAARARGQAAHLPPAGASYADFARTEPPWTAPPGALDEWRELLIPCPPRLALPVVDTPVGEEIVREFVWAARLETDAVARLRALAKREGATLTTVLLTALTRTMAPYASSEHITLNVDFANRQDPAHRRTVGLIGDNVALRMAYAQDAIGPALRRARDEWLDALIRWVRVHELIELIEHEPSWAPRASPLELDVNHLPEDLTPSASRHGSMAIEDVEIPFEALSPRRICTARASTFGAWLAHDRDDALRIGIQWQRGRLPGALCRELGVALGETLLRIAAEVPRG